ncbi:helicase associated domain-containing protein [Arthrobacter sp. ISL-5]|nr:helicase associated domain-containing protein [Arthrobacter sp. ISL-5]
MALTKLSAFIAREGHASVPTKHVESGHNLGAWINTERNALRLGTITPERLAEIDAFDVSWRKGKRAPWESEQVDGTHQKPTEPAVIEIRPADVDPFGGFPGTPKPGPVRLADVDDPFADPAAKPGRVLLLEKDDPFA